MRQQTHTNYRHIFIDDVSSDNTVEIVRAESKNSDDRFQFIENSKRKYRLQNIYDTISSIPKDDDDAVVCLLDGDDWLSMTNSLEILSFVYEQNPVLEYVYTNWMYSHSQEIGISKPIPGDSWDAYRDPWITSAMATFRVRTFKSVPVSNFLDRNGDFFKMGTDHAYVLPITHMLKKKHGDYRAVGFIDMPLYVYQFVENEMRRRVDAEGNWERVEAHSASTYIRSRGFLSE